jgi:hypothetical protein
VKRTLIAGKNLHIGVGRRIFILRRCFFLKYRHAVAVTDINQTAANMATVRNAKVYADYETLAR